VTNRCWLCGKAHGRPSCPCGAELLCPECFGDMTGKPSDYFGAYRFPDDGTGPHTWSCATRWRPEFLALWGLSL